MNPRDLAALAEHVGVRLLETTPGRFDLIEADATPTFPECRVLGVHLAAVEVEAVLHRRLHP